MAISRRTFLKGSAAGVGALWLGGAWGMAQGSRQGLILVSNVGDGDAGVAPSVSVIDPESLGVLATYPFGGAYSFPATRWDFSRDLVWSGLPAGPERAVNAYRFSTGERVLALPTGSSQNYTELTPDGRYVVTAARFEDRFLKISADPEAEDFGEVVAEFGTYEGASPCDITLTPEGRYAYAPDRGGDTLTVVDVEAFKPLRSIPVEAPDDAPDDAPLEPYMATASPTGNRLLVENAIVEGGSATGSESIFDLSDPARPVEVARFGPEDGLGVGPITSEITPDGRWGVVICRNSSELSLIDLETATLVQSLDLPEGSRPLVGTFVFDVGGGDDTLFVPLPGRDAVAAVRVPEMALTLSPVGARPMGAVYLEAALPDRESVHTPLGTALVTGRTFPEGCPDRCCGAL